MIFQYQQLAEPLVQASVGPPPAELTWLPHYPDRVPHRRPIYAPFASAAPFVIGSTEPLRVSQIPTELIFQYGSVLTRISQAPVETLFQYTITLRRTRVSQIAVEIIYPFGCFIFVPPLPNPCPAPNPELEGGVHCVAPVLGGGS